MVRASCDAVPSTGMAVGGCKGRVVRGACLAVAASILSLLVLGLITAPSRLLSGLRVGWRHSNLYGMSPKAVLRLEVEALQSYVSG